MQITRSLPQNPPRPPQQPAEPKHWTVMIWSASDNNLYPFNVADLDEAERIGTNAGLNVLAQVDHAPNPDQAGPHGAQRLELQLDPLPGLHSTVKAELGSTDMASPQALADFVRWGMENYPAERYWLVIADHGGGWRGANEDDSHGTWMSLPMIEEGLKQAREATGRKLDVLSFDCCLMASTEVAHQLKDEANYMVASQEVMGMKGLPYDQVLAPAGRLNLSSEQLVKRLVSLSTQDQQDMPTLSAVNLEKMPALSLAVADLGKGILASPLDGPALGHIVAGTQSFSGFRDLHDFADRLEAADPGLSEAAQGVRTALADTVVAEQHGDSHPRAHGLQIELSPQFTARDRSFRPASAGSSYSDTLFAQDAGWEAVIEKINS